MNGAEPGEREVAVVTGGASGIGLAIVRALDARGWRTAIWDIDVERAVTAAESIGPKTMAFTADVADLTSVGIAFKTTIDRLGHVDALINCAGWDKFELFIDGDPATWTKLVALNLWGPIHCTRVVLEHMIGRMRGRIVNIASDAGRVGALGEAVYSACKGGTIAFTKAIAREAASHNITVNCVCPGPTETPLFQQFLPEGKEQRLRDAFVRATPLGRLGRPEDVAPAVAFLCSDEAGFITGQVLSISGGLTMVG